MNPDDPARSFRVPGTLRAAGAGTASAFARGLARAGLSALGPIPARVLLWDGSEVNGPLDGPSPPVATVRIGDRATLLRLLIDPDVEFGDAYTDGRLTVEGDLVGFLEAVFSRAKVVGIAERLRQLLSSFIANSHGIAASRANVRHHYDLRADFFQLWLDPRMLYSCAYFPTPSTTLGKAQEAKLDHVCRKLDLQPDEHVVEAGCGWGALALHMAKRYGARVRAFNVSHEQVEYARAWAQREGLSARVEFVEDDYRNISGTFDAFVSVGMLEHVGVRQYRRLSAVIDGCLRPHARGLIHTMGRNRRCAMNRWIATRVFPGGHAPTLGELSAVLEPTNLSVLDVENLRLHYVPTIRLWREAFERSADRVAEMFDERFVRMWRLYLASAQASFSTGSLQLFQVLFARGDSNRIPWTRSRLYTGNHLQSHEGAALVPQELRYR
jgi:cyclopropane-fatty-acyl-phospholipid synthase